MRYLQVLRVSLLMEGNPVTLPALGLSSGGPFQGLLLCRSATQIFDRHAMLVHKKLLGLELSRFIQHSSIAAIAFNDDNGVIVIKSL
jgi:hypothetical protein